MTVMLCPNHIAGAGHSDQNVADLIRQNLPADGCHQIDHGLRPSHVRDDFRPLLIKNRRGEPRKILLHPRFVC